MNRRNFIRLAGGGTIAAATAGSLAACGALGSHYPAEAVEAWLTATLCETLRFCFFAIFSIDS